MRSKNDKFVLISIISISIMIGAGTGIAQEFIESERGTQDENGFDKVTIYIFLIIVFAIIGTVSTTRIKKEEVKN